MDAIKKLKVIVLVALFMGGVFLVVRGFSQDTQKMSGEQLYQLNCAGCHGINREGKPPTFPSLIDVQKRKSKEAVYQQIRNGMNLMPAFTHLSDAEVKVIITYLFGEGNPTVEAKALPPEKRGEIIFKANCATCHRATVKDPLPRGLPVEHPMMRPAPLAGATKRFNKAEFFKILKIGPMYMPSFSNLSLEEKEALWAYASSLEGKGEPAGPTMMQMRFRMMGGEHPGMMGRGIMRGRSNTRVAQPVAITTEKLARVIREHIGLGAQLNGGYYVVIDKQSDKALMLKLQKIHDDRLSMISDGLYFVCVDMRAEDGTLYDIDFFLKETNGDLTVSEAMVHKVNGKPRYTWKYRNGTWQQEIK